MKMIDIRKMEELGARDWNKGEGYHRVYINTRDACDMIGFSYSKYKTGNISSASINGKTISNGRARDIVDSLYGIYYDVDKEVFIDRDRNEVDLDEDTYIADICNKYLEAATVEFDDAGEAESVEKTPEIDSMDITLEEFLEEVETDSKGFFGKESFKKELAGGDVFYGRGKISEVITECKSVRELMQFIALSSHSPEITDTAQVAIARAFTKKLIGLVRGNALAQTLSRQKNQSGESMFWLNTDGLRQRQSIRKILIRGEHAIKKYAEYDDPGNAMIIYLTIKKYLLGLPGKTQVIQARASKYLNNILKLCAELESYSDRESMENPLFRGFRHNSGYYLDRYTIDDTGEAKHQQMGPE